MSRRLNTLHISHCVNKTPCLSQITQHRLSAPHKTSLEEEEEEGIIMNKILTLCLGLLIITLSVSSKDIAAGSSSTNQTKDSGTSAAGLGLMPTVLCLLIPAVTLGFIHSRS